jgi:hypothetical protein
MHSHECRRLHYIRMPLIPPPQSPFLLELVIDVYKAYGWGTFSKCTTLESTPYVTPIIWGNATLPYAINASQKKLYLKRCTIHMLNVKHDVEGWMMQNMPTCLHTYFGDVSIHICPSYFVL